MPSNPMQRKVRNSFLLGMVLMLLVALLIGALLFMIIVNPILKKEKEDSARVYAKVYHLTKDVTAGSIITSTMVKEVEVPADTLPPDKINATRIKPDTNEEVKVPWTETRAKVNLKKGTILSDSVLTEIEELDDSARLVEYNMIRLPVTLEIGEFVDVRITFGNGQDLIVVAKKEIMDIQGSTITLQLTEGEIVTMNSAIVEGYILPTSDFYLTKYSEPGIQKAAEITYAPTQQVINLINSNPNVAAGATKNFNDRYSDTLRKDYIEPLIGQYTDDQKNQNIETGVRQQIDAAKAAREEYLSGS